MSSRPTTARVWTTLGSIATVALAVYAFGAPFMKSN